MASSYLQNRSELALFNNRVLDDAAVNPVYERLKSYDFTAHLTNLYGRVGTLLIRASSPDKSQTQDRHDAGESSSMRFSGARASSSESATRPSKRCASRSKAGLHLYEGTTPPIRISVCFSIFKMRCSAHIAVRIDTRHPFRFWNLKQYVESTSSISAHALGLYL